MACNCVLGLCWAVLLFHLITIGVQASVRAKVAADAKGVLKTACHRCQGQSGTIEGGFGYALDREQFVGRKFVVSVAIGPQKTILRIDRGMNPVMAITDAVTILLGQSRGGLMMLAWAARHLDKTQAFVGIYPV
jgi:hypothetical protein